MENRVRWAVVGHVSPLSKRLPQKKKRESMVFPGDGRTDGRPYFNLASGDMGEGHVEARPPGSEMEKKNDTKRAAYSI